MSVSSVVLDIEVLVTQFIKITEVLILFFRKCYNCTMCKACHFLVSVLKQNTIIVINWSLGYTDVIDSILYLNVCQKLEIKCIETMASLYILCVLSVY